jgi:hypothetical protein
MSLMKVETIKTIATKVCNIVNRQSRTARLQLKSFSVGLLVRVSVLSQSHVTKSAWWRTLRLTVSI